MKAIDRWGVTKLTYEKDTEPYAKKRDHLINDLCKARNIEILSVASHTLNDLDRYIGVNKGGKGLAPSYQSFQKLFLSLPAEAQVRAEDEPPKLIPSNGISPADFNNPEYNVPSLEEMGYSCKDVTTSFHGGETIALQRLNDYVTTKIDYVNNFSKPNTSPNSLEPSTTVLSPYLKFGCLSPVKFYNVLMKIQATAKNPTQPPVSLLGQLLWREFFYLQSYLTVNFDKMENNPSCRQIPWERNNFVIEAWKMGRTGFPFIDAIMTQLRIEGWIHHLARHMVACFLTRGDLWQHWEEGVKVFDLFLLDSDWALNNANWQWLSCSNFFYQYFRVYSPIAFGKKTDPRGEYIRKWLPQLVSSDY
jgi:cryptochrome